MNGELIWLKKIGRNIAILFGVIVVFFATLFIAMSIANSPTYAWRVLRYFESDTQDYKIFPERVIENGESFSVIQRGDQGTPYEIEYLYNGETRKEALDELLERTDTRAFLIIKDNQLIFETYLESSRKEINTSFSSAKSFDSALIGAAIADGYIDSVNDPVVTYIPEITGRGLDELTIRDLLLMNSGIEYIHNDEVPFYKHPFGDDAFTYYSPDLRKIALSVQASGTPTANTTRSFMLPRAKTLSSFVSATHPMRTSAGLWYLTTSLINYHNLHQLYNQSNPIRLTSMILSQRRGSICLSRRKIASDKQGNHHVHKYFYPHSVIACSLSAIGA